MMNHHALQVLEFSDALEQVARLASSELGAAAVRRLAPSVEREWIETELDRVGEMRTLLGGDEGWELPGIPDVREALKRLRVEGSVWEAGVFGDVRTLLLSALSVRGVLRSKTDSLPLLTTMAAQLVNLPGVAEDIARVVDEDGAVRDTASAELARLRREIRGNRSRIVERLTAFAGSLPLHMQVADASVTVREGRYVIPVRREGRGVVGGIVHGESGSGATLFVEPPVAIELMNRLREAEAAEAREVHRILRELTEQLRPHQSDLLNSLHVLVGLDSLYARARYARRTNGVAPRLLAADSEEYIVVRGRHPVLLAGGEEVIPFDLHLEPGERTLLISGPNTGGKTVLLKAVGLISLLAQSGIIPPVEAGTALPIFHDVFADIGDEQSIAASLSTFSAHLKNLGDVLDRADWRSLVLIDEIGSGTDPLEGGALARAVLEELTRRSALTIATTHLGQLKLLATEERGVVNGSLQFDAERLQPTYRLVKGTPGRSYGLAIARRLGLPAALLDRAEHYLPEGERDVAKLLLDLEAKEQRVGELQLRLDADVRSTNALRQELEARETALRQQEKDSERRSRQQARDLLLNARQEVEAAIQTVRGAADEAQFAEAARTARRGVEEAAQRQRVRTPDAPARPPRHGAAEEELEVGMRVRIESLGKTGTVSEMRDDKAMVETGGLRLLLARANLTPLPPGDQQPGQTTRRAPAGGYIEAHMDAHPEVDLRGLRPDEVETRMGRALDAALMASLPTFRIIHGKGMGVLRQRVHELLRSDPRIGQFRPGDRFEGGTGVTVVEFG